ncbi:MAG: DUF4355 domain-containing protein [Clostridiales bacterium]|nr:DUF4355 domain-containing protein [Clostridiales bacterium]
MTQKDIGTATGQKEQGAPAGGQGTGSVNQEKTFTQEELNTAVESRLAKEREKYVDYDVLKGKAEKYDAQEESQKSEIQKLTDRLTAAEAQVAAEGKRRQEASWRSEIRKEKGIPEDMDALLSGSTKEEIEAKAAIIAENLPKATRPVIKTETGNPGSDEGVDEKKAPYKKLLSQITTEPGGG